MQRLFVRYINRLLIALSILLLSACGFSLRGRADLPEELHTLRVVSLDDSSDILREVRSALRANRITIVEEGAPYRLGLGRETISERTISVNSNARAGEYELSLSVMFMLSTQGAAVLGPETLSISRVYLADPESAVAKSAERELIEEEMHRELALQVLRRLQTFTP